MSMPKAPGPRCPHPDCRYRAHDVLGHPRPWGCNYSDITGHTRNKAFGGICPPDRCPFYDPGERQRMRVAPFAPAIGPIVDNRPLIRRGKHYDWEGEAKPMWLAGASDEEVAAVMGCNPSFAGKRRREMGIPGINTRTRKLPKDGALKKLHQAGLNDDQIALGFKTTDTPISITWVRTWRTERGLPPNRLRIKDPEEAQAIFDKIINRKEPTDG